jgi:hypothetical protein
MKTSTTLLLATLFACLTEAPLLAQESALSVDFSKVGEALHIKGKGAFDGPLPAECGPDFPLWNGSVVESQLLSENGKTFLRFDVKKSEAFGPFIKMPNPPDASKLELHGYYKVQITCRTPDAPLKLIIRVQPSPYTVLWEDTTDRNAGWVEETLYAYVEERNNQIFGGNVDLSKLPLNFRLSLKPGITDIAAIKLSKITKEEYIAAKSVGIWHPEKGQANLFRNSRFPFGLQSGWSISRDNFDGDVVSDPSMPGPSGYPSLKIVARTGLSLYTEPFQSDDPSVKNHLTFACKGGGTWKVQIIGKGGVTKTFTASSEWKTEDIEFEPAPFEKAFSVVFSSSDATLYLDSLMAYSGNGPRPYASAGECEVALAAADSETAQARIQFSDTPALVKYGLTGSYSEATLKAKVTNIHGQERNLPDIKLPKSQEIHTGTFDFNVFPEAPLGSFRIETWVERDSKRISPINELVLTRIRRPLYWGKDAPNSPFGDHIWPNTLAATSIKAAGVNWVRVFDTCMASTGWGWVERSKSEWKFPDNKVAIYRDAHLKILGYLGSAPTWASWFSGQKSFFYFDLMYQPKDIDAFKNYVRTTATHYKGVIDEYQFQNEPWGANYWHKGYNPATKSFDPGLSPALDYANLSRIAYEELKASYPEAILYGFNTARSSTSTEWTKGVYEGGAYPYCDMMDYHYYANEPCGFPDDPATKYLQSAFAYVEEKEAQHAKPLKPVVMSEGNPTRSGIVSFKGQNDATGLYKNTITWPSNDQSLRDSDWTCRYLLSHLSLGVKRIFLYSDHCYTHLLEPPAFPVLLGADGYPYPTLAAFSNLAWLLEDRVFVKRIEITDKVWGYLFEGRGESVAVISGKLDAHCTLPSVKNLTYTDLFGNPIQGNAEYKGQILYAHTEQPVASLEKALLRAGK